MATKARWGWFLLGILGCAVLASGLMAPVEGGKPKPPPPPPVHYQLTFLDKLGHSDSLAYDINNAGDVVGVVNDGQGTSGRAFLYEASTGIVHDVNDLAGDTQGWTATEARGINQLGQIVGTAVDANGTTRGFLLDRTVQPPRFVVLPESGPGSQGARAINNLGDIVGVREGGYLVLWSPIGGTYVTQEWLELQPTAINDSGQIMSFSGRRYTPGVGWEDFSSYNVTWGGGMSNDGTFVGRRAAKPREIAFRFTDPDRMENLLAQSAAYGVDVNSAGDVLIQATSWVYLYTDRDGLWDLNKLLVGDAADVAVWMDRINRSPAAIADRDATGFAPICGTLRAGSPFIAYVLTPVLPQ